MADVLAILAEAKKALEYSSSSLDSITTDDEEDMAPDGGSSACQACIKINKRAIAKIDAYLALHKPPSPRGGNE